VPDLGESIKLLRADISTASHELEMLKEHKFTEYVGDILVEAGELDDFIRSSYKSRGMKVDGYCFDEEYSNLDLIVTNWLGESDEPVVKVTNTEVEKYFRRCTNFFQSCKSKLYAKIEIANEASDLARLIYELRKEIIGVRIFFITDGVTEKRAANVEIIDDLEFRYVVWDIERIIQFIDTGEKEEVVVDFKANGGRPIPYLSSRGNNNMYETHLAFVPGQVLADIYSQWGTKMLDMNVRVFLSARGNVNRGIRDTIINEPGMFCAFNNGITVSAREIETEELKDGTQAISRVRDFQIVNGGQTVASLYHTRKKNKAVLSEISVQMKLIVINDHDELDLYVPRISEYSNTQNKVNLADLAANDPPHPEIHEISKRLPAPDPTGGSKTSYWFYEKARGSYEETKNLEGRTPARIREYEARYPKNQRFDKALFGKVWNTYLRKPYTVSLGAQKNFANFNLWLREQEEDLTVFFKKTVALVLLWKNAERVVRKQSFDGYRHNIVTYTLAWLMELTNMKIDLERLWKNQKVDDCILEAIESICYVVNEHIRNTDKNISEWCKKTECWSLLREHSFELSEEIKSTFLASNEMVSEYNPEIRSEMEIIDFCKVKGSQSWWELAKWLKQMDFLTGKQRSQCANMGKILQNKKEPSIKLSVPCKKIWEEAILRGWTPDN